MQSLAAIEGQRVEPGKLQLDSQTTILAGTPWTGPRPSVMKSDEKR
jgi:hypothetical protein